jgi:hypothetical protein
MEAIFKQEFGAKLKESINMFCIFYSRDKIVILIFRFGALFCSFLNIKSLQRLKSNHLLFECFDFVSKIEPKKKF